MEARRNDRRAALSHAAGLTADNVGRRWTLSRFPLVFLVAAVLWAPVLSSVLNDGSSRVMAQDGSSNAPNLLTGRVGALGTLTDELQSRLGFHCSNNGAQGITIDAVRQGTQASKSGLQAGDKVLDARVNGDDLDIAIDRKGHPFTFTLSQDGGGGGGGADEHLSLRLPRPGEVRRENTDKPKFDLNAEQVATTATVSQPDIPVATVFQRVRILSNFDIELIVDRSDSMHARDCPGNLSRWNWCGQQSQDLARQLAPFVPRGLNITTFGGRYDIYENTLPQVIEAIFDHTNLEFGTRLFEPLSNRLQNFFNHYRPGSKPLLIAIITDGVPFPPPQPQMVGDLLVKASRQMSDPHEVTVVFFQIGGRDRMGKRYLEDLDRNLVKYGAKYDYVHMVPFEELKRVGLAQALVDSIQEFAAQLQSHPPQAGGFPAGFLPGSNLLPRPASNLLPRPTSP